MRRPVALVQRALVDELFLITQPAHLQKSFSEKLSAEERDLLRADMLRARLRHVSVRTRFPQSRTARRLDKANEASHLDPTDL